MAGGKLLASAHFGPAWAEVKFGADGIVYFDPFRFEVDVYASISAGVTIDVWIGEITISVSMGASRSQCQRPQVPRASGVRCWPDFAGCRVRRQRSECQKVFITWEQFVTKYLEEAAPGVARVLSAIPGKGSLAARNQGRRHNETGTADGSTDKPFEVYSEFEITVTTTGADAIHLRKRSSSCGIPAEHGTRHCPGQRQREQRARAQSPRLSSNPH